LKKLKRLLKILYLDTRNNPVILGHVIARGFVERQ
jgi:hypothetical protein